MKRWMDGVKGVNYDFASAPPDHDWIVQEILTLGRDGSVQEYVSALLDSLPDMKPENRAEVVFGLRRALQADIEDDDYRLLNWMEEADREREKANQIRDAAAILLGLRAP